MRRRKERSVKGLRYVVTYVTGIVVWPALPSRTSEKGDDDGDGEDGGATPRRDRVLLYAVTYWIPIASQPREQAWPSSGPSRLHRKKPPTGKLTRSRPGNPGHGTELARGFQWVRDATARIMDGRQRPCRTLSRLSPHLACSLAEPLSRKLRHRNYLWWSSPLSGEACRAAHHCLNHDGRTRTARLPPLGRVAGRQSIHCWTAWKCRQHHCHSSEVQPPGTLQASCCHNRRTHMGKCMPGSAPTTDGLWLASPRVDDARLSRCRERGYAQRRFNRDPCPKTWGGAADDVTRLARRPSRSLGRTRDGSQRGGQDGIAIAQLARASGLLRLAVRHSKLQA